MSESVTAPEPKWPLARGPAPTTGVGAEAAHDNDQHPFRAAPPAWLVLPTLAGGLWLDREFGLAGQLVTSAWVWALFLVAAQRSAPQERWLLVKCIFIATVGELICSLAWGLYDYQLNNVPAYVPPGHVLLLMLGVRAASRWSHARAAWTTAATAVGMAAAALWWWDLFSLVLLAVLALLWRWVPSQRRTFAALLPLALALELLGTALGNWTWQPIVPGLGLPTHNPPFAASVFYCLLECLVLQLRTQRLRTWLTFSASPSTNACSPAGDRG